MSVSLAEGSVGVAPLPRVSALWAILQSRTAQAGRAVEHDRRRAGRNREWWHRTLSVL